MNIELNSMESICGKTQIAGVIKIEYAPLDWISDFPEFLATDYGTDGGVGFISGKNWLNAVFAEKATLKSNFKENKNNGIFENVVEAIFPYKSEASSKLFNEMVKTPYIIKCTLMNKKVLFIGNKEAPASFSFTEETGKEIGNFSGVKYSFSSISTDSPIFNNA